MDTFDCIRTRRTVRKFLPAPIPETILLGILDAANAAPCAGNIQSWRFLVVEDEKKKKIIAKSALEQEWIADAPTIVMILSDVSWLTEEFEKKSEDYALANSILASENLMLAAWNFGVGSAFIGSFIESSLRREFKIPDKIKIHAIIPLGYPDPTYLPRLPSKIGMEDQTSFEEYGKKISKRLGLLAGLVYPEKEMIRFGELAEEKAAALKLRLKKTIKKKLSKKGKK